MFGFGKKKAEKPIGEVTHYFGKIGVAVVKALAPLKVGDQVKLKGATTDFTQAIESMELDHANVEEAKKGQEVGMKIKERVREGDQLFHA